jgi:copper(I)-binding protein
MPRLALEIVAALALTLAAILSLASGSHANEIMVTAPFARASATPVAKAGAAYFTITNADASADRIIGVSADIAMSAMIHESVMENGVATMREVGEVEIAPGDQLRFEPGNHHVMLVGLKKPLKEGEHFVLTLRLERAGEIVVDVPVGGVAASAPP